MKKQQEGQAYYRLAHLSEEQRIFFEEIASLLHPEAVAGTTTTTAAPSELAAVKEEEKEEEKEEQQSQPQQQQHPPQKEASFLDPSPPPPKRGIVDFFKIMFKDKRNMLMHIVQHPGSSKTTFLNIIRIYEKQVKVSIDNTWKGPPHAPIFHTELTLQSKKYANVFIRTKGIARKKKEAEVEAFHRLVCSLV
ncbi:hypothetical protein INT47_007905 [Mucor saturninus]|uniref:DRBM domain-containing protein n=1 Tax=Mucor saturninus TaxID=64648 RepID=A0A8H7UWN4_9FUNG|nr:hypothetical protein INT47_007905 [Mucor saturninus]